MNLIDVNNTDDAIYNPHAKNYWDKASLNKEIKRTFEVCQGCRMCFKYCTAFPSLFKAIDNQAEGSVLKLSEKNINHVVQECYQCKICYVKCPYTDQDNHQYNLDFPALMQRATHVRARKEGISIRDKILQDADKAGFIGSGLISIIINSVLLSHFYRQIIEKVFKIHRDKLMPSFHKISFERWYQRFRKKNKSIINSNYKVILFSTCFVNYNDPQIGKDAIFALEKNNIDVIYPKQNCCGMPGLNTGDLEWATRKMKKNIKNLYPYVKQGYKILAINPTCSLTLKKEYTAFLTQEYQAQAEEIAKNTYDIHEYLFKLKKEKKLNRLFKSSPDKISYHIPCHLRAQNIGYRSRDIMRLIPNTQVDIVEECCGHNGNWAMKKENFSLSLQAGSKLFNQLNNLDANEISTDCPLAALQLQQGAKLSNRPLHPIQILAKAYKIPSEGGFSTKILNNAKN